MGDVKKLVHTGWASSLTRDKHPGQFANFRNFAISRSPGDVGVLAVNRAGRLMVLDTDEVVKVDAYYDRASEETDDPCAAMAAVAQIPDGRWIVVDLRFYPPSRSH